MELKILRGGMLTTVQDLGRRGHRHTGVPLSGAVDTFALRIANALVGNPETAAALECSLVGPELELSGDTVVAFCGADCAGLESWRPTWVSSGERVAIGPCTRGAIGYLAIAGGIEVPLVMGSRSTYLRGGFGGFSGRPLAAGDVIKLGAPSFPVGSSDNPAAFANPGGEAVATIAHWRIDPRILPLYTSTAVVRVIAGAQASEFGDAFFSTLFKISSRSDRMGVRLEGSRLIRSTEVELLSTAVAPGTIQVPPNGEPLVLMADAQTIGGYPQVAHVISVDLPVLAQLRPGDTVKFAPVSLAEAHRRTLFHDHAVAMLREGLSAKLRNMSESTFARVRSEPAAES